MSYSIHYGPEVPDQIPVKASSFGWAGVMVVLLVCAAAIGFAMPEQMAALREALLPWEQPVVQEAFGEFQQDLDQGEDFSDAMRDFCRDLLREAENGA